MRVEWSTIADFVIVRSDGNPIFFLANAVDDIEMGITHVIRGEDLLDSTHRVLALREALGVSERPSYAHLPLIVGPDRAKLSKRHGAVAIEDFRTEGYLPEAVCNYLALLGWAPEDGREVMALDEIVARFDLDRVTHAAAAFDHKKLDWMNGEWIRRLTLRELEARALPLARERFGDRLDLEVFRGALRIGQERAVTVAGLVDQADFLFVDDAGFRDRGRIVDEARRHRPGRGDPRRRDPSPRVVRVDGRRDRPPSAARHRARHQDEESRAGAVRRDRGPPRGFAAVRLDRAARPRPNAGAAARRPGTSATVSR